MHESLCLKILYIHNCSNLFFCPRTIVKLRYPKIIKLQNSLDFFHRSVILLFTVQLFLLPLVLIAQRNISVLATLVTSSNLC